MIPWSLLQPPVALFHGLIKGYAKTRKTLNIQYSTVLLQNWSAYFYFVRINNTPAVISTNNLIGFPHVVRLM